MPRSLADSLPGRDNALNALRLGLATIVIVSHAFPLGGYRASDPTLGHTTIGRAAVLGFFAISGYLITQSRESTTGAGYLWRRFLRIFPGFWVCLLLIAGVAAPLAWLHAHGTRAGYPVADALRYVGTGGTLFVEEHPGIAGTLTGLGSWNAAAWSLLFEVLCYLGVALLAWWGWLRPAVVGTLLAATGAVVLCADLAPGSPVHHLFDHFYLTQVLTTATMFLGGATLYLLRSRIPDSRLLAVASAVVIAAALLGQRRPEWLLALPTAYLAIWLGAHLKLGRVARYTQRVDLSYGVYIYAYPAAVLLSVYGVSRHGVGVYLAATVALTVPLAYASWYVVEHPAMRLRNLRSTARRPVTPQPARA